MSAVSKKERQVKDMLGRAGVPSLAEARLILQQSLVDCPVCAEETVPLADALQRVLAGEVEASEDLPPHPRSTMDGYAVRAEETFGASESLPSYLAVSGEVRMGEFPETGPGPESCFQIATGGLLPPGTNAVVMFEHTVAVDAHMIEVVRPVAVGANVIQKGDDVRAGSVVLRAGRKLRPQDLGLLAGLGRTEVTVYQKVRVGIFSTGDEIVPCNQQPGLGQMRDMNSANLAAMAASLGALPTYYGVVADEEEEFLAVARRALLENDLIVFSGSSSVGSRDMGERVVARIGSPGIVLHGVAIKPGKPVIVSFAGGKAVFGLPGHPVSAAVAFELFVKPAVEYYSGRSPALLPKMPTCEARCMRNINSAPGRTDFIRVALTPQEDGGWQATPILGKSGALSTMVEADGFFVIAESCQGIEKGEMVTVFVSS